MSTLADVSKKLVQNNAKNEMGHEGTREEISKLGNKFDKFFRFMESSTYDKLEEKRESQEKKAKQTTKLSKKDSNLDYKGLLGAIAIIAASISSFIAALAGFRGWELAALKNLQIALGKFAENIKIGTLKLLDTIKTQTIGKLKNVLTIINGRIVRFVDLVLERLGILKFEQMRNAAGRFTGERLTPTDKIVKFMKSAQNSIAPITKAISTISKISFFPAIYLFELFTDAVKAVRNFSNGTVMKAFEPLAKVAKTFGRVFTGVLKPLAVLFSFVDGLTTAMDTEGDLLDKISAGTAAFLGDFFGAPIDLLKDLSAWILGKMGFDKASEFLKGIKVEEFFKEVLTSLFKNLRKFFENPIGTAGSILTTIKDAVAAMFDSIIKGIAKKFGIDLKTEEEKAIEAEQKRLDKLTKDASRRQSLAENFLKTISQPDTAYGRMLRGQTYNKSTAEGSLKTLQRLNAEATQLNIELIRARQASTGSEINDARSNIEEMRERMREKNAGYFNNNQVVDASTTNNSVASINLGATHDQVFAG